MKNLLKSTLSLSLSFVFLKYETSYDEHYPEYLTETIYVSKLLKCLKTKTIKKLEIYFKVEKTYNRKINNFYNFVYFYKGYKQIPTSVSKSHKLKMQLSSSDKHFVYKFSL